MQTLLLPIWYKTLLIVSLCYLLVWVKTRVCNKLTLLVGYAISYPDCVLKAEHIADKGAVVSVLICPIQTQLVMIGNNANCYRIMYFMISHHATSL